MPLLNGAHIMLLLLLLLLLLLRNSRALQRSDQLKMDVALLHS
jgi:hypothetical protein